MPRLSKAMRLRLEADILAGKMTQAEMAAKYNIQPRGVGKHETRLEDERRELEETNNMKAQGSALDTQAVRKDDLNIVKKAVLDPVLKKVNDGSTLDTKDVAILLQALNTRTKILDGYDKSHKLQLNYFDMRDQSTNIDARGTVARELFDDPDLCGECRLRLLAKHAKDVTQ